MNVQRRICGLALILAVFAGVGIAQDKKREAQLRTVRGVVSDKSDSPLSGSVVFLKNVRTNSVRSFDSRKDIVLNLKIDKKKS